MLEIDGIKSELKKILSERRYVHSLGVAEEAEKLARRYGADQSKAYLAGLVHDCAKEFPPEEMEGILKTEYGVPVDSMSRLMPKILHGPLGACEAQRKFEIYDPEILDAIKYHTTGNANMDILAKIIFVADKIEDGRKYKDEEHMESLEKARKIALQNLNEAVLYEIDESLVYTIRKKKLIHPDSIATRNKMLSEGS